MSVWTARIVALGARTAAGGLIGLPTLKGLTRLLPGRPVCAYWEDGELDHPYAGARVSFDLDQKAVVGSILGARVLSDGVYGVLSITRAALDHYFLEAEREGRLLEGFGLSLRGYTEDVPVGGAEPLLMFTELISLDVVKRPLAGGCLLQSSAAEAAGLPCPVPPKLTPPPRPAPRPVLRPAREHRGAERVRSERTGPRVQGPIATEFRTIREGEDY